MIWKKIGYFVAASITDVAYGLANFAVWLPWAAISGVKGFGRRIGLSRMEKRRDD